MNSSLVNVLFPLGLVSISKGVLFNVPPDDLVDALFRHAQGDWGDVCDEDWNLNEEALERGDRIMSVYHTSNKMEFWIITLSDRTNTAIILSNEC